MGWCVRMEPAQHGDWHHMVQLTLSFVPCSPSSLVAGQQLGPEPWPRRAYKPHRFHPTMLLVLLSH
jgi:hypothetical protein